MGDSEAVLGLDGLKEGLEGAGEERGDKTRPSVSSCSSRGSQMEVKLPWYMGITCQVRGERNMRYDGSFPRILGSSLSQEGPMFGLIRPQQ